MATFQDQIVWITGGGSGIGRAMALEFAAQGAHVAVSGRRVDRLEQVAGEIRHKGRQGMAVPCDVTKDEAVREAVEKVVTELGRLDVAVVNAGMGVVGPFEKLSDAEWRLQFGVNIFGAVSTARYALPHLRKSSGRLALVASVAGLICAPGASPYSASKFALRAIGLTLSQELHGSGVTCTTLHPGFIESEIAQVDNRGHFDPSRRDKRPKKLLWPTDQAARVMVRAIERRKREYIFTGHGKIGAFLGQHLPGFVHFAVTRFGGGKSRT